VRGTPPGHIKFTMVFAGGGVEHSRLEILLPEVDASDSRAKRACLQAKGTAKGPRLHTFLEAFDV
jgi:hypothetical protein